jgi:parallel beta-helix repeat protein
MWHQGNRNNSPSRFQHHLLTVSIPTCLGLAALLWLGGHRVVAQVPPNQPDTTAPLTTVATSVIYVNPTSGNDQPSAGKTEAAPYRTISFALQQATAGTIVQLASGNYVKENGEVFPLTLKPGVIVRGDEASKGQTTLIQGSGGIISKTFAGQNVTILAAQGSELRGVTVTNLASRGTGVWVEDTNPTIANSTFTNSVREGVFITGAANPIITDSVFTKNQGNGISIAKSAQGTIKNNLFFDTGFGLAIGGNSTPVVTGNQINQNQDGLFISDNARPILRNNTITENKADGVVATSSAQPDLGTNDNPGNNTIRNNKQYDLNNSTKGTLVAIGNNIDPKKISGTVDFVASTGNVAFQDVQGHWAQAYIQALAAKNIITGFPDGTFKPNEPVTRAQFAAIILKAFAPASKKPSTTFSDVTQKYWAYDAIQTASKGGFMAGYPGSVFKPEQKIPRVQVLVALANGLEYGAGDVSLLSKYQDAATIPSYASGLVASATQRQVVVNYPTVGQLNPNREATRAEVAAFIYQSLVSAGKAQSIPSPYIVGGR